MEAKIDAARIYWIDDLWLFITDIEPPIRQISIRLAQTDLA